MARSRCLSPSATGPAATPPSLDIYGVLWIRRYVTWHAWWIKNKFPATSKTYRAKTAAAPRTTTTAPGPGPCCCCCGPPPGCCCCCCGCCCCATIWDPPISITTISPGDSGASNALPPGPPGRAARRAVTCCSCMKGLGVQGMVGWWWDEDGRRCMQRKKSVVSALGGCIHARPASNVGGRRPNDKTTHRPALRIALAPALPPCTPVPL